MKLPSDEATRTALHRLLGLALTLGFLIGPAWALQAEPDVSEGIQHLSGDDLHILGQEAFALAAAETTTELETVSVRFISRPELQAVLKEELGPQMVAQLGEGEQAETSAESMSKTLSEALMAKFAFGTGEILVCRENIKTLAKLLEIPELNSLNVLKAVLVHESVHAIDHARYDLNAVISSCTDMDSLQAVSAVIEGHAQHVSRKACASAGLSDGFEIFERSIDTVPQSDSISAAQLYVMKVAVAQFTFAYKVGERFIDELVAIEGEAGIQRAFQHPPKETAVISRPIWYMLPESRALPGTDIEAVLRGYEEHVTDGDEELWGTQIIKMLAAQLAAAMSYLPSEDVDEVLSELNDARILVMQFKERPQISRQVAVFVMSSPLWADRLTVLEEQLLRAKDEAMKTGNITIESADYTAVDEDGFKGVWAEKTISAMGETLQVKSMVVARGSLVMECNFIGGGGSSAEGLEAARMLLQP